MARKTRKQLTIPKAKRRDQSWAVAGIDISLTSISGAMLCYDALLDQQLGVGVFSHRWTSDTHFLDRLAYAVKANEFMSELAVATSKVMRTPPFDRFWVGVEEAWPSGIVRRAESMWLRQQAQIQGCFIGGLVRWGFTNVYEVNNQLWKNPIREETGIGKVDKWIVKDWAIGAYSVPDLPDLIKSAKGIVPRPEKSKAKAHQPDDVYDACGILAYMDNIRLGEIG